MNRLTSEEIQLAQDALTRSNKVVIVSHYNPDGDAMGSSLAIYHYCKGKGKDVHVILPNLFPSFLNWMPGADNIVVAAQHADKARKLFAEADLMFVVDMNAPSRFGSAFEECITDSKAFKILIDHHVSPIIDCNVKLSETQTTSTCELVYNFLFDELCDKEALTLDIAECIYVGMITDTGSLSYMCNHPETYLAISELMKKGVDGEAIHRKVYDNYSESRLRLLGLLLSQRLKIMNDYATSYSYLTKEDLIDNNFHIGDTEGFVNYGLSVGTVKFTAFFTERDNRIRVSFRSKGDFDVNKFARKHFDGGGHKNASAAYHYDTLENTMAYFEEVLKEYKDELTAQK